MWQFHITAQMQDTGGWEKVQKPDIYSKTASGHAQVGG